MILILPSESKLPSVTKDEGHATSWETSRGGKCMIIETRSSCSLRRSKANQKKQKKARKEEARASEREVMSENQKKS